MNAPDPLALIPDKERRLDRIGVRDAALESERSRQAADGFYSHFLRWMKWVLPMGALSLIAVLLSWNSLYSDRIVEEVRSSHAEGPKPTPKNELLSPHFDSTDEKGQPYAISARRAIQGETDPDRVFLEEPLADLTLNTGHWFALKAKAGEFSQKANELWLKTDVILYHDAGYAFETQALDIQLREGRATTKEPVSGQGPAGTLTAQGMTYETKPERLIFQGQAKLVLFNLDGESAPKGVWNP